MYFEFFKDWIRFLRLIDRVCPKCFCDVVGQKHLFGEGAPFLKIASSGAHLIFYGPSGTGKTTVAKIIAENSGRLFYRFNATDCTVSDIKKAIYGSDDIFSRKDGILIYLDEIQYFNRKQQQSLLGFLDDGRAVLVASTTENPFFAIYKALFSRCLIFEFVAVEETEICKALSRAFGIFKDIDEGRKVHRIEDGIFDLIAASSGGDVRRAVNLLEACLVVAIDSTGVVDQELVNDVLGCVKVGEASKTDKEMFYDLLSALQKSIRGSDENAAIYYLARILNENSLQAVCRRLLVMASEDVGLAYPDAAVVVRACVDNALQIGWPQAKIALAQAVIMLSILPKSNSSYVAINRATKIAEKTMDVAVPRHLQNVHCDGFGSFKNKSNSKYVYPHDYRNHYVKQSYLPEQIQNERFFEFGENKFEQAAKVYREKIMRDTQSD